MYYSPLHRFQLKQTLPVIREYYLDSKGNVGDWDRWVMIYIYV